MSSDGSRDYLSFLEAGPSWEERESVALSNLLRYVRHTKQGLSHQIQGRKYTVFYCWWFYILFHGQGMVYYKNFRVRKEFIKSPQITYTYRENIIAYSSFSALLVHRWQNHHLCFSWLWKNMKSEFEIMGTENPSSWFKITVFCFTISFYKWNNSHKCYINTLHFVNQEIVCKYLQPRSLPVISFSLYSSPFNPLKPSFTLIA